MSATLAKLRKRAAEFEQKKQLDRALDVYIQILDEGGKDLGDEDVPLFNRVGDMLMRKGSVTEALGYYERAVDMYAERGFLNNAIALCSKILRQSPGRAAVYYKLGRISARKGFKSDARKNFLEYADRMQKAGQADEAFRALKEFASLYPDQDDVRLILAELLSKENRKGEALEQLQSLYQKLQAEGRQAEARATVDRMRAIDPRATPQAGGAVPMVGAGDLVFLDLSDDQPRTLPAEPPPPVSARAPEVASVPALSGLAITFLPDESEPERPDGFEATSILLPEPEVAPAARQAPTPAVIDVVVDLEPTSGPAVEFVTDEVPDLLPELLTNEPGRARDLVLMEEDIPLLDDLDPTVEPAAAPSDIAAPLRELPPLSGSEFAGLELEEAPRIDAPPRHHDLALPGELPGTPEEPPSAVALPASEAAGDDARVAAEEAADLAADVAARETWQGAGLLPAEGPLVELEAGSEELDGAADAAAARADAAEGEAEGLFFGAADVDADMIEEEPGVAPEARDDFLTAPPTFGESGEPVDHAFPPLFGLEDATGPVPDDAPAEDAVAMADDATPPGPRFAIHTPRSTISIGSAEAHLRRRLELEPENWGLRRMLGEALLDTGDRDGGLYELELAMVGFELENDLDRAQEVVDEILGVLPGSVRHHQKRVEYAVRSRDRARLAHAYLELADALFRTGAGDRAVAVYARVLEFDSANERAEFALATLAPDELVRLRGVPARPERWTDELDAIDGGMADRPVSPAPVPDEPAAGAGAPSVATEPAPLPDESAEVAAASPESNGVHEVRAPSDEGDATDAQRDGVAVGHEAEPADAAWESGAGEETPASDLAAVVDGAAVAISPLVPEVEAAPWVEDGREHGSLESYREERDEASEPAALGQDDDGRPAVEVMPVDEVMPVGEAMPAVEVMPADETVEPSVVSASPEAVEPVPPPRSSPPRLAAVPDESPRIDRARALTPAAGSDADFVDLGEWLRTTEPTRSTRMLVEDPKPTGDEQADFDELLRRFKRGVAENVEAEDYEAHYDLGVAYKEMGLVDEAIAQFQKALRGSSHRVRSYEALGQCFVEKEQYPIAAALLQRATEVPGSDDQQLVGVLYLLGFAMERMGRPAEALPYYLRVFAVDIEFRDVAARVAAMGNLTT